MNNNFKEVFLYTNQDNLKRYLITNEINAFNGNTLSDNGYSGLLLFTKEVSIEDLISNCCNNSYDTAVVIKLLINADKKVIGIKEDGTQKEGLLSEFTNINAFLFNDSISFSNVKEIIPVEKELMFLQGDSTLKIPFNRISKNQYNPLNPISSNELEQILSSLNDEDNDLDDFSEEDEENFEDFSFDDSLNKNDEINYHSKVLGALLMLIQGNKPIKNILNPTVFSILTDNTNFDKFVMNNVYKNMNLNICKYIEKPNDLLLDYYHDLKEVICNKDYSNSLYSTSIKILLDANFNDKETFKNELLNSIKDIELKKQVKECLEDRRARNRIKSLKESNDSLLPIYFLYTFFDYGFDRLNENIIEFNLDNSFYSNILLSLWGLKNGMEGIYEEFKDIEVIYALEKKISSWLNKENDVIPLETFYLINNIKLNPNEIIINNYRCSYINSDIENLLLIKEKISFIEKNYYLSRRNLNRVKKAISRQYLNRRGNNK